MALSPGASRRRALVALLALAMSAAACGSTVPVGQAAPGAVVADGTVAGAADDQGLSAPGGPGDRSAESTAPLGSSTGQGSAATGATAGGGSTAGGTAAPAATGGSAPQAGGGSAPGGSTGSGGRSGSGGTRGGGGAVGPGVTDDKILVGRIRTKNGTAANEAMGIAVPAPPTERLDQIMVDHLASEGGTAGRKIEIVYYTIDATGGQTASQNAQGACEQWTEDRPVHSALSVLPSGNENLQACLAERGVPHIGSRPDAVSDAGTYQRFPAYFDISAYDLTRQGTAYIDGLVRQGFFKPGPGEEATGVNIGLVSFDDVIRRRAVKEQVEPALARHGLKLADDHYFTPPNSEQETAQAASEFPGVVLRFKTNDINRVLIFADIGGGINIFFARTAENQNYYPRYGLTSTSFAQAAIDEGLVNPSQYRGAINVGWNPFADHGDRPQNITPGEGMQRCRRIINKGGMDFDAMDINAQMNALATCDAFFLFDQGVEAGAPALDAAAFVGGIESLGSRLRAALSYGAVFGPAHHSGVSELRHSDYRDECRCFKYTDNRFHSAG